MAGLENPDAAKPYIGMLRDGATSSTSSLKQDQVYNRSGQTSLGASENVTAQARKRAKGGPIDEERNEQNIIGARAVQRRAVV